MNGFTRTPGWLEARRLLWLGYVAVALGFSGWNQADAAAIHHNHESALVDPAKYQTWSEYLMGGDKVWSTVPHPVWNKTIETEMIKEIRNDPPPDLSPVVQYFLYKQSLDPPRFDYWHPKIAKALAKIEAQLADGPTTSTSTTPTTQPQQITPVVSTVPEPATLLLAIGMTGYALWWRRRHSSEPRSRAARR